ncbi:sugar isomerase [Clostridium sp.]|uniref:lipopolysaccharide biosynthesis protein n=1 Tax=Clostridium sp. TaxID=1506 RepID=UPI001DCCFC9A|nr:sugar isomerase [Clostridium sp.]MBS5938011.1 sugar isomerase [Clostridium sp.]
MKFKRSIYNIIVGVLGQLITIIMGIIIPKLFITSFGSEVNGLMTSITQIYVYIGLLEAGIGTATIQALYKPIANEDKGEINGILSATDRYYKKTGLYYFFAIVLFAVIYPFTIKADISKLSIFFVIIFTGLGSVINYLFQGKYKLLLTAEGKNYIVSSIATIINVVTNIAKIVCIYLGYDIVTIQVVYCIINISQMIFFGMYIKRHYKWLDLSVKPNKEAISQKNFVLIHQISSMVFSNTDILILTYFTNLKVVSVYSIYNMVYTTISNILAAVNTGLVFTLGQTFQVDKKKYIKLLDCYETYYMCINFALYTVTYLLILPFLELYTAGITDINYIDKYLPILFLCVQALVAGRSGMLNTINIAGHFKNTWKRSVIESIINIVVSLAFVGKYGIYGILIGTITALLYRTIDIIIYSNVKILNRSTWSTFRKWIVNISILLVVAVIGTNNMPTINSYIDFFIVGIKLTVMILPVFIAINSIIERNSYNMLVGFIKKKINFKKA